MGRYKTNPTIYGTGLIALDIVLSSKIDGSAYNWAGGTCGNVLTILSYLGWSSFPIARLNDEPTSLRVKDDMKKWGVQLDFSELTPTASVPIITQENLRDDRGLLTHRFHWKICPKCKSWLPNYKSVTLNGTKVIKEKVEKSEVYFFDRTSPGALDLARYFREQGCVIFFEPSANGNRKHFEEAIKLADIVKYSDQRFSSVLSSDIETHRPILEIQTLGGNGLRYRHYSTTKWRYLEAFKSEQISDTSGCGDWTSAGIISQLCNKGRRRFLDHSVKSIESALRYGQALGAWNCNFEGARHGMYQTDISTFNKEIGSFLSEGTQLKRNHSRNPDSEYASDGLCPACP